MESWAYNVDRGKVVFLDKKKAFDTVDHEILLSKLSNYGKCDNAHSCLVILGQTHAEMLSRSCSLSCGVPQGTILGLLLFLLYINDLPNCLSNCQSRMYADDTRLTYPCFSAHNI